jgi:multicomponent Na+:H+ antiporter subunit G
MNGIEILIALLASFGAILTLLAGVGIVRMPDLYLRISVTTKAASLGVGVLLICAAIYFHEPSVTTKVLAIILFILLTAPVGAHLIGRVAYIMGVPLWKKSVMDDLKGQYKGRSKELQSEQVQGDAIHAED